MIKVEVSKKDRHLVRLKMRGHAGAGPYGEDIVCAAATQLARAIAAIMLDDGIATVDAVRPGKLTIDVDVDFLTNRPSGDAAIAWWRLAALTDVLVKGMEQLQAEYPQHLSLDVTVRQ